MDFSQKCYLFCECNSVRIGQNIQNEVSQERSIFADVLDYQFKLKAKWFQEGKYASFDMEEKRLKKSLKGSTRMLIVSKK